MYHSAESLLQACDRHVQKLVFDACVLENEIRLAALVDAPPLSEADPALPVSGNVCHVICAHDL